MNEVQCDTLIALIDHCRGPFLKSLDRVDEQAYKALLCPSDGATCLLSKLSEEQVRSYGEGDPRWREAVSVGKARRSRRSGATQRS